MIIHNTYIYKKHCVFIADTNLLFLFNFRLTIMDTLASIQVIMHIIHLLFQYQILIFLLFIGLMLIQDQPMGELYCIEKLQIIVFSVELQFPYKMLSPLIFLPHICLLQLGMPLDTTIIKLIRYVLSIMHVHTYA